MRTGPSLRGRRRDRAAPIRRRPMMRIWTLVGCTALLLSGALTTFVPACSSDKVESGGTSGGTSAGGTGGAGGAGNDGSCPPPARPPVPGAECAPVGSRCSSSGEDSADYLCTSDRIWTRRDYAPVVGGAAGVGEVPEGTRRVDCSASSVDGECQSEPQCATDCCDGAGTDGAIPACGEVCCRERRCAEIPPDHCPSGRCQLVNGCDDELRCVPVYPGPLPECGKVTATNPKLACCQGLTRRCGRLSSDGTCDHAYGMGAGNAAICIACGDGTCEDVENPCNCPEDCGEPE